MDSFNEALKKYARLAVRVGLNIQPGQRLIIFNSATRGVPLHAAPLVREITREAYEAGASYVDVIWNDQQLVRTRVETAPADSFGEYSDWHIQGLMDTIERGGAILTIRSNDPDLLNGLDPERVGTWQKTHLQKFSPVSRETSSNKVPWLVISASGPEWAAKVFPSLPVEQAEAKLWEAIFQITRADRLDPVAAWDEHIRNLARRGSHLTQKQFASLKYTGPGTDLTIGLPGGHKWISAGEKAQNGIAFIANIPTEEVFTLPHREQTDGTVTASMPLSYGGTLIEDFSLTFEKGRVIQVSAKKGEAILRKMVETDEGAGRLGEVALVPVDSPIAERGHLFYDTLIDENASCHLAVGRGFRVNLEDAQDLSDEEFTQRGGNLSINHVDFMIGSKHLDIDGIRQDGSTEPVMRQGKWAIQL
jgi:aminopeptidase